MLLYLRYTFDLYLIFERWIDLIDSRYGISYAFSLNLKLFLDVILSKKQLGISKNKKEITI